MIHCLISAASRCVANLLGHCSEDPKHVFLCHYETNVNGKFNIFLNWNLWYPEYMNDREYMKLAIDEADKAVMKNEVPVGAIIVDVDGNVLSRAYNQPIRLSDPTGHAEILALRKACKMVSNYRLPDTTLYVTIEPCVMCMGAIIHARIARVVFGAYDPKWGGAGSLYNLAQEGKFNHRPQIVGGVCEEDCRRLMQGFFRQKRKSVASDSIMS